MATLALQPLRFDKGVAGTSPEFISQSVSGTLREGDLLLKTNGVNAKPASNSPARITHLTVCASTETTPGVPNILPLVKIRACDTFEISAHHSTAASAVVADSDLDGASVYGLVEATVSGVAAWCMDLQDTSNARVRLVERISSATDLYPRCRVQFMSDYLTYTTTA